MRNVMPLLIFLIIGISCFSQVGINTTEPSKTLDVNGSIRVRGMNERSQPGILAKRLLGVDEDGTMIEVEVEERLNLDKNRLYIDDLYRWRDSDILDVLNINQLRIVILPGEPNDDKRIMNIVSPLGLLNINGIAAGVDGESIWLFSGAGILQLQGLNLFAAPQDQILRSGTYTLQRYDMVQLVYNGTLQKWIIMDN